MNSPTVSNREIQRAKQEVVYLSLLLTNVNERLADLKPGINCTFDQYNKLKREKISLTLGVNKAKLKVKGYTFVEESDTIYAYNNIVLMLGGTYRQRVRA